MESIPGTLLLELLVEPWKVYQEPFSSQKLHHTFYVNKVMGHWRSFPGMSNIFSDTRTNHNIKIHQLYNFSEVIETN